ncbi:MAG TPA: hypothetical protein VEW25_13750 [Allosphingosinicella sp.]|nr:hypothetical protein [Allosphingosinicella sp.]
MLIANFLLMSALAAPLEAQVVGVELQRIPGEHGGWYNRVEVEFASTEEQVFRLCPGQASVGTARLAGDRLRSVNRYQAHAMTLGPRSTFTSGCRDLTLRPGQAQRVTFSIRGVPGQWRGEDRYTLSVDTGARRFQFVEAAAARR